ncbi:flavin-containing monooxygenase [Pseudorhodoferax sp.]|uniref:flavin-containing monooxygenase n=1 Tax=Pseudorhodoferax sp. TaxID=1993553 RepID=UPI002DD65A27|nr:NAD(P)/FAD-dependent oxidoreductase [Pseudorhodoferax sp.]
MHRTPHPEAYDAVVVGAGFAGLYMLHKLRAIGLRAVVLEAGDDIGGTWHWNRYPGARCDVESLEYSYSFDEQLQHEWRWAERYAPQPEILRYIHHVADRFDLRRDIRLDTRVVAAARDEAANRWTVTTASGDAFSCQYCIMAVGCLSLPSLPPFKGRDSFTGKLYHTGLWPREGVDFSGQRVGVIGTGSSGIQAIPELARQARHLYVFQRTPHYSLPAFNRPLSDAEFEAHRAQYPALRERARHSRIGVSNFPVPDKSALEVDASERSAAYEGGWNRGSTGFTRLYKDLLTSAPANATAAGFVRDKIQGLVHDPRVAQQLTPDYAIGIKRLCLQTGYFDAYNRDNVTLVDVKNAPIESIVPDGIQTRTQHYALDAIVLATGYDAVTGALNNIDIRNGDGAALSAKWAEGPRAYLGLMSAGYPNLFLVTGPGSPSILANVVMAIEQHVEWIADCLQHLRSQGFARIDASAQAEADWVQEVNAIAHRTLLPTANSWYMGANIPGKPRVFMPYAGGLGDYRARCEQIVQRGYTGFRLA